MSSVYVVGVGMHPFGKFPMRSVQQLARFAIRACIDDAAVSPSEVGAAYVANCYHGFFTGQHDAVAPHVLGYAGLSGMAMVHVEGGGAAGSIAFHEAVLAVMSGQYATALAVGVEKLYVPRDPAASIAAISTSGEVTTATQFGLTWVGELAMSTRRLMNQHDWTAADFALVASKNRRHAAANVEAELQKPISPDEVLAERIVVDPLTRPMCAGAAVDGAAAVLVAREDVAARVGAGQHPRVAGMGMTGSLYTSNRVKRDSPGMLSMDEAPRSFSVAYERAGVGPEDIEVVQLHDSIAPEELVGYQVIGLCKAGDEVGLLRSGSTAVGGRVPVNTDGGMIARGHPIAASGVAQVVETVRQIRGSAGRRQVLVGGDRPPRVGAIQNAGAQGGPSGGVAVSAAILLTQGSRP